MIRSEIVDKFRQENSEIPSRVISDAVIESWLIQGDKEFCAETRCIVDQGSLITTVVNEQYWDLEAEIPKFYDIDIQSTSGVTYNAKALIKTSMSELDMESKSWRARNAGVPKKWFRRGKYLWFDRKVDSAADDIVVYSVLISDDWTTDIQPYNDLDYLSPFHSAMVLYLTRRAKAKVGKPEEAMAAQAEYSGYMKWARSQLGSTRFGEIYFRKRI